MGETPTKAYAARLELYEKLVATNPKVKKFFDLSHAYVSSLKPKPTRKKS